MPEGANDKKNMSRHILPTSANLLGLCFVILSLVKIGTKGAVEYIIDELVMIPMILFLISSVLSYTSMRSRSARKSEVNEKIADIVFLTGLLSLALLSIILIIYGVV